MSEIVVPSDAFVAFDEPSQSHASGVYSIAFGYGAVATEDYEIVFASKSGDVLRFKDDGRIFVRGVLATEVDRNIVLSFRDWLWEIGVPTPNSYQRGVDAARKAIAQALTAKLENLVGSEGDGMQLAIEIAETTSP